MKYLKIIYNKIRFLFVDKNAENPADINLTTVRNYIQGNIRSFIQRLNLQLPEHVLEQVEYRTAQVQKKSPKCLLNNSCVHCGCKMVEKILSDASCDKGCFSEMMSKEDWIKFKSNL